MGLFERYLSVWVGLCIVTGVLLGNVAPGAFEFIARLEYAHVNLVVALFIWIMIYPMMVQIDFSAIKDVGRKPRGLILTLVVNWLIKPFTMAALGWLFFRVIFALGRSSDRHRIHRWYDTTGRCPLYGHGLCLEPVNRRRPELHPGTGVCERHYHGICVCTAGGLSARR